MPGDSIKVTGAPPATAQYFFVGGEIRSPGQKPFHPGLTLTQAILASGGTKTSAELKVKVSRQATDGKLATKECKAAIGWKLPTLTKLAFRQKEAWAAFMEAAFFMFAPLH